MKSALAIVVWLCLVHPMRTAADGCFLPPADYRGAHLREPAQRAVIVHAGGKQTLILFVDYAGGSRDFAWVIPCPSQPQVRTADPRVFQEIVRFYYQAELAAWKKNTDRSGVPGGGNSGKPSVPVVVHASRRVGPYQIQIVSSSDAGGLKQWLADNAYHIPDGVEPMLQQYVEEQWYFAAVKVRVKSKTATLKPLQLDFASKQPVYPLRISSAGQGLAKLIIYLAQPAADADRQADSAGTQLDFSGLRRACPKLTALRPDVDWKQVRLQHITATLPTQVMKWHDDRSILPGDFAMAAGIAEAWMSKDRAESQWAESRLLFYQRFRPNSSARITDPQRAALAELGQTLGKPFFDKLCLQIARRSRSRITDDDCNALMYVLPLFGDRSPSSIRTLSRAADSGPHGNDAINVLMMMGSPDARRALVTVARSNSPHKIGAWFRYVYGLQRNRISKAEQREACQNLILMLSSPNPPTGDANRRGRQLLQLYTGQQLGEDWQAWKRWVANHPEHFLETKGS